MQRYREKLRKARLNKGWTMPQAARAVGVRPKTWISWEYGWRTPSLETAKKIAQVFETAIDDLF